MFARLAPILLLISCGTANAYTGNDLLRNLKAYDKNNPDLVAVYEEGVGFGYIQGAKHVLSDAKLICIPETVTYGQARSVVQKYLESNPEALHRSAHTLVANALMATFPCKK